MPNRIPSKSFGRAGTILIALVLSRTVYNQVISDVYIYGSFPCTTNISGFKKLFPIRSEIAKKESEDNHRKGRLNNRPQAPKNRLFITDFNVSLCQEIEEFAICPYFLEVDGYPASLWLDDGDWKGRFVHASG